MAHSYLECTIRNGEKSTLVECIADCMVWIPTQVWIIEQFQRKRGKSTSWHIIMSRVNAEKPLYKGIKDAFIVDALSCLSHWEHFTLTMHYSTFALELWYLSMLALEFSTISSYHVNASLSRIHVHAYVGTHSMNFCVSSKRHTLERAVTHAVLLTKMEINRCCNRITGRLTCPMQRCRG